MFITHGKSHMPEYHAWVAMRHRCEVETDQAYSRYGGRGISVCKRWSQLKNFLADMGLRPSKDHTLDRIDNNGNYEPSNCRWATRKEQQANRRNSVAFNLNGESKTVRELAEAVGMTESGIRSRIHRRLPLKTILSPRLPHRKQKLSTSDVLAIRDKLSAGTKRAALARQYGIAYSAIWAIGNGTNWKFIK